MFLFLGSTLAASRLQARQIVQCFDSADLGQRELFAKLILNEVSCFGVYGHCKMKFSTKWGIVA